MAACHAYHGYFASCGGLTGRAGPQEVHRIGGMRQEVDLHHLTHAGKAAYLAAHGDAKWREKLARVRATANAHAAEVLPHEHAALLAERDHRVARLAAKTDPVPVRKHLAAEVVLLNRQLARVAQAEAIRTQKLARLHADAVKWATIARQRPSAVNQHYADKAAAEHEAYATRAPVHYTHLARGAADTLRDVLGHAPSRAEIAHLVGAKPGSDITVQRRGNGLHVVVHGPGWTPFLTPPHTTYREYTVARDAAGKVQVSDMTPPRLRRMALADLRDHVATLRVQIAAMTR